MNYFAYGSNMLSLRLAERIPSAEPVGTAVLGAHVLRFHKSGRDGSAKCDIHYTGMDSDCVHGVVFEIAPRHESALDDAEDVGRGYGRKRVTVNTAGHQVRAFTYYALQIDPALQPFHWYKDLVLAGAKEHGLPRAYIDRIQCVPSCPDSDWQRQEIHELILKTVNE